MNINSLKAGDLIVRQKGPLSTHYIVWIGIERGRRIVAENQDGIGVHFTTLESALAGNEIKRFEKFGGTETQRYMVVPKIRQLLGKPYDLIVFNCEHFARWISTGKLESKQVKTASNIALVGGAAMLASKNKVVRTIGIVSVVAGIIGHATQAK